MSHWSIDNVMPCHMCDPRLVFCCCCFRSRKGLVILDLNILCRALASSYDDDDPNFQVPMVEDFTTRMIPSISLWDVGVVKWAGNGTIFASTSNQKTHIWDARHETYPLIVTLQKHFRPVTGVAWSPFYSNVLATCSADSKIHLWDVRVAQHDPIQSFMVPHQGAQYVAWNQHDGVKLASAHDNEFRLWDTRKGGGGAIAHFIGHTQQITGINFSHDSADQFLTASNDKTVKLWELSGSRVDSLAILQRVEPVHFAMFAPLHYGRGVLTNQYGIGEQSNAAQTINLWSVANLDSGFVPQYTFRGPSNTILSVCWRISGHENDSSSIQVASIDGTGMFWLHSVRQEHLNACIPDEPSYSHKEVNDGSEALTFVPTLKNISLDALREDLLPEVSTSKAHTGGLWRDVYLVETMNVPGVVLEEVNAQTNTVDACITHFDIQAPAMGISSLYVSASFPPSYPASEPPELQMHGQIELESKLTDSNIIASGVNDPNSCPLPAKVLEEMRLLAMKTARRALALGGSCLEPVLRSLSTSLDRYVDSLRRGREGSNSRVTVSSEAGSDATGLLDDNMLRVDISTTMTQGKEGDEDGQQCEEKRQQQQQQQKTDVNPFEMPCPRLFSASFSRNNMLVVFGLSVNQRMTLIASPFMRPLPGSNDLWPTPPREKRLTRMLPPRTYNLLLEAIHERLPTNHNSLYYSGRTNEGGGLCEEQSPCNDANIDSIGYMSIQSPLSDDIFNGFVFHNNLGKSMLSSPAPHQSLPMQVPQVSVYDFSGALPGNRLLATRYVLGNLYSRNCCYSSTEGNNKNENLLAYTSDESPGITDDSGVMWGMDGGNSFCNASLVSSSPQTSASCTSCIEPTGYDSQPPTELVNQKQWDSLPIIALHKLVKRTSAPIIAPSSNSNQKDGGGSPSYFNHSPPSSMNSSASMIPLRPPPPGAAGGGKVSDENQSKSPRFMPRIRLFSFSEVEEDMDSSKNSTAIHRGSPLDSAVRPPVGVGRTAEPKDTVNNCIPRMSSMSKICLQCNAQSAALVGENEIADVWAVLTEVVEVCREFGKGLLKCRNRNHLKQQNEGGGGAMKKSISIDSCWVQSVLVGPLLGRILDHYMRNGDPQTSAMLLCTLQSISFSKHLLNVEDEHIDRCIDAYADLLFIWGALNERTELLKYKRCTAAAASYSKTVNENNPRVPPFSAAGNEYKNIKESRCSVCQLALRGIGIYCIVCGHGGHPEHIFAWFEAGNEVCPTGCSCRCLEA